MNKISFLLLISLCTYLTASAQKEETRFFKNNGRKVNSRDSADYIQVIKAPVEGSTLFSVNEYYANGNTKSTGYSRQSVYISYEGAFSSFFKNGSKKLVGNYDKGILIGTVDSYYPNGKLYTTVIYGKAPDDLPNLPTLYYKIVRDSIGKGLVTDGNGDCVLYDEEFKNVIERGPIKKGVYDGLWKGEDANQKLKYTETYSEGKLISGESIDDKGVVYNYTEVMTYPKFEGGNGQFGKFLEENMQYPSICMTNDIEGKVYLSFVVNRDGTLSDMKVLKTPHPAMATEALRILKKSPAWIPGMFRGKKVRVRYNLPIAFALSKK